MEFVEACKVIQEMCAAHKNCDDCVIEGYHCQAPGEECAREMEPRLIQWRKEHPVKTVADYFLEHLPNADIRPTGTPQVCCKAVGLATLATCKEMLEDCNACWRREWKESND